MLNREKKDYDFTSMQKLILFGCALLILFFSIYFVRILLLPFIIALVLSYLLSNTVNKLESFCHSRILAILLIYLVFCFFLVLCFVFLIPLLLRQGLDFINNTPRIYHNLANILINTKIWLVEKYPQISHYQIIEKSEKFANSLLVNNLNLLPNFFNSFISIVANLFLVPVILFFFLLNGNELKNKFFQLIPNRYFEKAVEMIAKIDHQLSNYLRGLLIDICLVGFLATIVALILKINYAYLIGLIVGLCNLIPYFGPVISLTITVLIFYFQVKAVLPIIIFVICLMAIYSLDGMLLQPLIYSKSVNLHPLFILVAIILGGAYGGILGMIIAVPAVSILKVIFIEGLAFLSNKFSRKFEETELWSN